jgi:RNA polymerase sigma-70 factor (ECF subfamily)
MSQQQTQVARVSLEELLAHAAWARRLARRLVNDDAAAEDTVQDAFLAGLQTPPASGGALRGWLRKVLRHERSSRLLSDQRREARERAATAVAIAERPPSPEDLTAAVEVQRLLAGLVLALPEPFRQTLVLRYYQDLSSADIARLLAVPAGTVRWRLKQGLSRLRVRLDEEHGGTEAWRAALAPIAAPARSAPSRGGGSPAPSARPPALTALMAGAGAIAVATAVVLLVSASRTPRDPDRRSAGASDPRLARAMTSRAPDVSRAIADRAAVLEGDTMKTTQLKRVAAFLGVGLPAMVASARQTAAPPPQEIVDMCLTAQEKSFACKDEIVSAWLALRNPPEKHREAMRQKMLEELTAWGSGPLPSRREKCEQLVASAGPANQAALNRDVMATMRACFARPDCPTRAACIGELMVNGLLPEAGPSSKSRAKP